MKLYLSDFPIIDARTLAALRAAGRSVLARDLAEDALRGLSLGQVAASLVRLRSAGLADCVYSRVAPTRWHAMTFDRK